MADIRIDTSELTYTQFLIPGQTPAFLDGAGAPMVSLAPGSYAFQQMSGVLASFTFQVTDTGLVDFDPAHDDFLAGRGTTTLTIRGFRMILDATALSHGLLPMIAGAGVLTEDRTHELVLAPSDNYGFQPAAGVVAEFRFGISPDGEVTIPREFTPFAHTGPDRTLVLDGHRVRIDIRKLSHGLLTLNLVNGAQVLAEGQIHEYTYIPANGYGFQPAAGVVADFRFGVTPDGQLTIDPKYASFAHAGPDRTLVLGGYQVIVDARDLAADLVPAALFSQIGPLPGGREHKLTMLPASRYTLLIAGTPEVAYSFALTVDGGLHILDAPGGAIIHRPLPPPVSLRSFYADLFMPARGSVRAFTAQKWSFDDLLFTPEAFTEPHSLRAVVRDRRDGLLRGRNLREMRLRIIDDLFDGATSEEEEDTALRTILESERAHDLIFLINKLTWDGLDDDLDEHDLDTITDRLKVLLDRRDYLVGFLLRWFFVVDDDVLPNIDANVLTAYVINRPLEVRHSFADQCLTQRDAIRDGVAHMALRNRDTHARDFRLVLDNVAGPEQYRQADLQALSWEVFYTDLICSQLSRGEYGLLLRTLTDLFNPTAQPFPARNLALFNMLRRWERHLAAMERAIAVVGTERQKADARRFGDTRRLFMDNFPPVPPPAPPAPPAFLAALLTAIQTLQTTLGGVGTTIQDLARTVQNIAATIENISVGELLGTIDDDRAVSATNLLAAEGLLALLPSVYKSELIDRMLGGALDAVEDDEESAILTILRDTKTRSAAEFLQLARSATWERLDSSFNGTEHDALEGLFRF